MAAKSRYVEALEKHDTGLLDILENSRGSVLRDGALPKRVKILMMMLVDSILNHEGGVGALANQARDAGASEEEIKETVQVAYVMGGLPGLVAGTNAYKD